jgi:hypothetical protein
MEKAIQRWIDDNRSTLTSMSDKIWAHAELGLVEHKSSKVGPCKAQAYWIPWAQHRTRPAVALKQLMESQGLPGTVRYYGCPLKKELEDVITTLITPLPKSSLCHSGRSFMISLYKSTAILRLIVTIIALPSNTFCRSSKCVTMSFARVARRSLLPTIASSFAHFIFAAFASSFSSTRTMGIPLIKRRISGRLLLLFSITVNWLTTKSVFPSS